MTALNTGFYAEFCFVLKEDGDHYEFALRNLQGIYTQLTLGFPKTIIVLIEMRLFKLDNSRVSGFQELDHPLCP